MVRNGYSASLGSGRCRSSQRRSVAAGDAESDAEHHLQRELHAAVRDRARAAAARAEDRDHQRDADRVVGAGLALEQGAGAAGDLAPAQHREDHGRVGRARARCRAGGAARQSKPKSRCAQHGERRPR